ncbi:hypothetical protein DIPPA_04592 [Diplonema papillatum]|nr:hypothetical protein DIPPA_04592 [Diplonema papillatum]
MKARWPRATRESGEPIYETEPPFRRRRLTRGAAQDAPPPPHVEREEEDGADGPPQAGRPEPRASREDEKGPARRGGAPLLVLLLVLIAFAAGFASSDAARRLQAAEEPARKQPADGCSEQLRAGAVEKRNLLRAVQQLETAKFRLTGIVCALLALLMLAGLLCVLNVTDETFDEPDGGSEPPSAADPPVRPATADDDVHARPSLKAESDSEDADGFVAIEKVSPVPWYARAHDWA